MAEVRSGTGMNDSGSHRPSASFSSININYNEIGAEVNEADVGESAQLRPSSSQVQGTSWYISIFLVVNIIIGGGLLNFPQAYHQSGGILVATILICLMTYSLIIFLKCAHMKHCRTYQDVIQYFCGPYINFACSIFIFLYTFGSSIIFLIIIGDQWDKVMENVYDNFSTAHPWYLDRKMFIAVSSIFLILPLCYAKRIDFLKYASSVGVLAVMYCVLLVVVKYFKGVDGSRVGPVKHEPKHASDIFLVVPTICFAYQCHLSIVQVYVCTKDRAKNHNFTKTIILSMLICFVIYSIFAVFGYLTFGACVQPDLLLSYKATPEVLAGVVSIALKMYMSYPIMLYVGRSVADDMYVAISAKLSTCCRKSSPASEDDDHTRLLTSHDDAVTINNNDNDDNLIDVSNNSLNDNNHNNHINQRGVIINDSPNYNNNTNNSNNNNINNNISDYDVSNNNNNNNSDINTKSADRQELKRRVVITSAWFVLSLVIALYVPGIDKVISFLGGVSVLFIFVLPGMCYLKYLLDGNSDDLPDHSADLENAATDDDVAVGDDDEEDEDDDELIDAPSGKIARSSLRKCFKYCGYVMSVLCILIGGFIFGVTTTQNVIDDVTNTATLVCV
ncbi:hypothetical protein HELRODRAFT_192132 [Helobdella robusta]|uniref:Amino acid transporter transmembrane domain-containing protein n=1 Tax=Helobdella robusta TaxID=6412 RepID=T1FTM0_HELRO|nr:hypothetical protein HELRODRAFT_192132 [Helobdella robusta]ESO03195.1 hypothetical protein HELRODRAFT_192132 [Helobdella robusta]